MPTTVITGMSPRTLEKLCEGTGITFNINAGGAIVFVYKGEVISHKKATEIIEDYRRRNGLPGIGEAGLSTSSSGALVPPKKPKSPATAAAALPKNND
jgi:hypothetical protein